MKNTPSPAIFLFDGQRFTKSFFLVKGNNYISGEGRSSFYEETFYGNDDGGSIRIKSGGVWIRQHRRQILRTKVR